jgi:hypothetical protein
MIMKTKSYGYATCLPLAFSVSCEERCEVLASFHVVMKMYRYSLEDRMFIVKTYWITGSIKNCQRRFVEQFDRNPPSTRCIQLLRKSLSYLIFSCYQLPFCEFRTSLQVWMQMYCTFVLFVNQHFPGLPESGTHCRTMRCTRFSQTMNCAFQNIIQATESLTLGHRWGLDTKTDWPTERRT